MNIYAFKNGNQQEYVTKSLLENGSSRFGWGYLNLLTLKNKKSEDMTPDEQEVWSKTNFLLNIIPGDWIVHINTPTYGKCTAGIVNETYKYDLDPIVGDFGHCIPLLKDSIITFDRNDKSVHPSISSRLKLQGRYWRINNHSEFLESLDKLSSKHQQLENITEGKKEISISQEDSNDTPPNFNKILSNHKIKGSFLTKLVECSSYYDRRFFNIAYHKDLVEIDAYDFIKIISIMSSNINFNAIEEDNNSRRRAVKKFDKYAYNIRVSKAKAIIFNRLEEYVKREKLKPTIEDGNQYKILYKHPYEIDYYETNIDSQILHKLDERTKLVYSVESNISPLPCPVCSGSKVLPCPTCSGTKIIKCKNCKGKGLIICKKCGGEGGTECPKCDGEGRIEACVGNFASGEPKYSMLKCNHCNGTGKITCSVCHGNAKKKCITCDGSGYLKCYICDENGQIECHNCKGTGNAPGSNMHQVIHRCTNKISKVENNMLVIFNENGSNTVYSRSRKIGKKYYLDNMDIIYLNKNKKHNLINRISERNTEFEELLSNSRRMEIDSILGDIKNSDIEILENNNIASISENKCLSDALIVTFQYAKDSSGNSKEHTYKFYLIDYGNDQLFLTYDEIPEKKLFF